MLSGLLLLYRIEVISALVSSSSLLQQEEKKTLSFEEVSELRVRDIKRRLTRYHGYTAEEVARHLDKKELIELLAFEEEKIRLRDRAEYKRSATINALVALFITIVVIFCWPMVHHVYEVASVNLIVYYDRKKLEATRCYDLNTYNGIVGVLLMGIIDVLQVWLTLSVILSWVMSSKYFFPVPNLSVKPAALMGGEMGQSKAANYGINVGSMAVTWGLRFLYGKIERFTGKVMSEAMKRQRKQARQNETQQERDARKAAKRERQNAVTTAPPLTQQPESQLPPDWMHPRENTSTTTQPDAPVVPSDGHQTFLNEMKEEIRSSCELDEMD